MFMEGTLRQEKKRGERLHPALENKKRGGEEKSASGLFGHGRGSPSKDYILSAEEPGAGNEGLERSSFKRASPRKGCSTE